MEAPVIVDRRKFLGGSDISAILGINPYRSAVDLWIDKTTPPVEDGHNAAAKRRGSRLEPYIRDMIVEEHGLVIVRANERYIDPEYPFLAVEIDAETETENIEIKTVHPFKAKEWGNIDSDELPLHYIAQAQHALGIRDRRICRLFALIGDELKPYIIERDDELIAIMRVKAIEFWTKYVVPKVQPPLEYINNDVLATLKKLYPGSDGTVIEATAMHEHWRAVHETASEMRQKYEGILDGAKAHLLAEMGKAAAIRFDDGKAFTRKIIARKGYVVEPTKYLDFRLSTFKE